VCLKGTHRARLGSSVKYFAWDEAKNERLKADRGVGFEEIVFHIERGDLLRPTDFRCATRRLRVPGAVRRGRTRRVPEDDHPEPQGNTSVLGRGARR
jgi:hypothetical protein